MILGIRSLMGCSGSSRKLLFDSDRSTKRKSQKLVCIKGTRRLLGTKTQNAPSHSPLLDLQMFEAQSSSPEVEGTLDGSRKYRR